LKNSKTTVIFIVVLIASALVVGVAVYLRNQPRTYSIGGFLVVDGATPIRVDFVSPSGGTYSTYATDGNETIVEAMMAYSIRLPLGAYDVRVFYLLPLSDREIPCDAGTIHIAGDNSSLNIHCTP